MGFFTLFYEKQLNDRESEVDAELERLAKDLDAKRLVAIERLGDKWLFKGGEYNRGTSVLNSLIGK